MYATKFAVLLIFFVYSYKRKLILICDNGEKLIRNFFFNLD
jgi:hypothetical protein